MFQPNTLVIGLGILVAMLICYISRLPEGARVAGYICGIVIIAHGTQPWSYVFLCFTETVLGIGLTRPVSFIPKLIQIEEADSEPRVNGEGTEYKASDSRGERDRLRRDGQF